MKHYLPEPDDLIVAALHGAASRHAGWRAPTGAARRTAVAELREIAAGRTDLLSQVAGLLLWYAPPGDAMHDHNRIAAELLVEAGAEPDAVARWIETGRRRRANARGAVQPRLPTPVSPARARVGGIGRQSCAPPPSGSS